MTTTPKQSALTRRSTLAGLAALGLSAATAGPAWAQAAGDGKPVRFVLPNAVSSGVDTITRSAQTALAKALGHPVVVDNQPGAGGIVGLQALARSAPDGLTLSVVSNNVVIFPSVMKALPIDVASDFTPIAVCGYTPVVLVVNPAKVPATNSKEFTAWLKSRNGEANFASGGNGTILHLAAEMYIDEVGVKARHIPYKGVGPMLTDLIGGQVEFATAALPSVQAHLKTGALRAIGIATDKRVPAAADIPTFTEQGVNYVVEAWFAVLGPKGLPAAEVKRINAAVVTAFADPEVMAAMAKQGNVIHVSTPEKAQAFFKDELVKFAKLVRKAGIEAQ
jgi:tripartite-type tricarboxylate transporter receptor subunit TctC